MRLTLRPMARHPRDWLALLLTAALGACGHDDPVEDPAAAAQLWQRLQASGYRAAWARPPGWEARRPSVSSHGDEADIFVNETLAAATGQPALSAWPEGSLLVKDSYRDGSLRLVAAMEKRDGQWFFAEWTPAAHAQFAGQPGVCTGCHASGDDMVRAFGLPR